MNTQMSWPLLDYTQNRATYETLHRWMQIVGKVRLAKTPWTNHSWHSTLYVTDRGLTTTVIHDLECSFSIDFDFIDHALRISKSDGEYLSFSLISESVSAFYKRFMGTLSETGIQCAICEHPNELMDATPFSQDQNHCTYEPQVAENFWRVLLHCDRLMKEFRSHFVGKVSPVHFFWGSFDIAVTRFSGRRAPEHPGGFPHLPDIVAREAYSHEVSSCGFWPGNEMYPQAAFYSYAYPMPEGFGSVPVGPTGAFFNDTLKEFILPYEAVCFSENSSEMIREFFQTTYEAAANLGKWDRQLLEESSYLKEIQNQWKNRRAA